MIIKPNRGRDWLDWQRKVFLPGSGWAWRAAADDGRAAVRRDGDPAVPAFCVSTPSNWITELADLQRLNGELRAIWTGAVRLD